MKLPKCKTLSISGGSVKEVVFQIDGRPLTMVKDSPEKFLGTWITGTSHGCMNQVKDKMVTMLNNIDMALIRPEYKLKIYTKYYLHAIKFMLSVHDLTKTQRSSLDNCSSKFIKKWLNMPQKGATLAIIYCEQGLNIPSTVSLMSTVSVMRSRQHIVKFEQTTEFKLL